jgi:hypothetical protein
LKNKQSLLIITILFLLGNLPILININSFVYLGSSNYSDIPITHFPNLHWIRNSIINHHQIPLWTDLIFSGYPFSSNPLSGLWYFPGWIALLFPLPIGINISLLIHLLIGIFGMYFFLKDMNLSENGSIFGAIAFTFSAKIFSHIGAGHLYLIYAIIWTPLFLKHLLAAFRQKNKSNLIISGLLLGLIILADVRWLVPLSLIWLTIIFYSQSTMKLKISQSLITLLIGLLTSIALWIPLLDFLPLTTRTSLNLSGQLIFSMKLVDFLNLFFPILEGSAELEVYSGGIIILLFTFGIINFWREKELRAWYILVFVSFLLTFGENIPGLSFFYSLPGIAFTRVPARFLFSFLFGIFVLSSIFLDRLVNDDEKILTKRPGLIYFPLYIFIIVFSIGAMISTKSIEFYFVWPIIIFSFSLIVIYLHQFTPNLRSYAQNAFVLILFIDLIVINSLSLRFQKSENVLASNIEIIETILKDRTNFRVYSPSYSITQEESSFWGIKQVNGVDPMQLTYYADFFEETSGIPIADYTVTLPPFSNGNPSEDNASYCPDVDNLRTLNAKYVVSDFPMNQCFNSQNISLVQEKYIYKIFETDNYMTFLNCDPGDIRYSMKQDSPNRKIFDIISCGGLLQVSEINYPGWRVFVSDQEVDMEPGKLLRTFFVSEGLHEIEMRYEPLISILSAYGQLIFWICAFGMIWIYARNDKKTKLD